MISLEESLLKKARNAPKKIKTTKIAMDSPWDTSRSGSVTL